VIEIVTWNVVNAHDDSSRPFMVWEIVGPHTILDILLNVILHHVSAFFEHSLSGIVKY
jgi:hypothetical protein